MNDLEKTYPSVQLAYPIAINAYDVTMKRLEGVDGRLQTLLTFIITISALFVSNAGARGSSFTSPWFVLSVAFFLASVTVALVGRMKGKIRVLDPRVLFESWLHLTEWEFKKNLIYASGKSFEANSRLLDVKFKYSLVVLVLFTLELVGLVVWVWGRF